MYTWSDYKHMWWLFTVMVKCGFKGDWEGSREARMWLGIHARYNSKKIK